jgi:hypothetical protein
MKKDILRTIINSISDEEYRQLWSLLEKLKDKALSQTEAVDVEVKSNKG